MLIDSHFSSAMEGVLVGGSSTGNDSETIILRTVDGGATWTQAYKSSNGVGEMGWKFSFPSDAVGYVSVQGYGTRLDTIVTFTLTPTASGTHLRLEHAGFTAKKAFAVDVMGKGWRGMITEKIGAILASLG